MTYSENLGSERNLMADWRRCSNKKGDWALQMLLSDA